MRIYTAILIFLMTSIHLCAQSVTVNGYVFESGNRGYLNQVEVEVVNKASGQTMGKVSSNMEGYFEIDLPANQEYTASAKKSLFFKQTIDFDTKNIEAGKKQFVKIQLEREPGYDFEVTLAPKRDSEEIPVDAIRGAWIEVYDNTTKKEILNLKDHPDLEFNVHFEKGSHYTIMVRKEGFFTKRMEAFVNVEGCILCFEGVGSVRPGVVDNLTEGNEMGVLLANVELDPLFSGKTFKVENIYYDFAKATLRPEAKKSLKNLALVLNDNAHILVELGSHTDSRGKTAANQKLSEKRAKSAVDYLVDNFDVSPKSIIAAGYGESLLDNECSDGVDCTEEKHQENRRTEVKVLNISNSTRVVKTLAEIRVEEEFMRSVMEDDLETKVISGDEEFDSKPSTKVKPKAPSNDDDDSGGMEDLSSSKENDDDQPVFVDTDIEEGEEIIEKVEEISIEKTQIKEEVKVVKESSQTKTTTEKVDIEKERRQATNSVSLSEAKTLTTAKISEDNTDSRSVHKQRGDYRTYRENKYKLGEYTGHKLVIHFSKDPISGDHEIYERHDDVMEYKASSGSVLYLIGDFESKEKAEDFLNKTVLNMYPAAYHIHFENGKRIK